jgi:hypothetical protein
MRVLCSILLLLLCLAPSTRAVAQASAHRAPAPVPITLSFRLSQGKPALSARGLLLQTGVGILGGIAGMAVVGLPLMLASWESPVDENLTIALIGGAYFVGTAAGIHYAGRGQGMRGNPWATAAGTLGGLVVSGAMMQPFIDDEGNAEGPGPLLVFLLPSAGGTTGYALTRRFR